MKSLRPEPARRTPAVECFDEIAENLKRIQGEVLPPCDVEPAALLVAGMPFRPGDTFKVGDIELVISGFGTDCPIPALNVEAVRAAMGKEYCIACDTFGCTGNHHSEPVTPERLAEIRAEFGWTDDESDEDRDIPTAFPFVTVTAADVYVKGCVGCGRTDYAPVAQNIDGRTWCVWCACP